MPASLTVLAGPLAGTRLDIEDVVDEILIGSDPDCRLALDLPGVSPIHARLWLDTEGMTVHDTHSPRGVYVNDTRVVGQASLRDGDVLWLGVPGDENSVGLECHLGQEGAAPRPVEAEPAPDLAPEPALEPALDLEPAPVTEASADVAPIPLTTDVGEMELMTDRWAEPGPSPASTPVEPPPVEPAPPPSTIESPDELFFEDAGLPSAAPPVQDAGVIDLESLVEDVPVEASARESAAEVALGTGPTGDAAFFFDDADVPSPPAEPAAEPESLVFDDAPLTPTGPLSADAPPAFAASPGPEGQDEEMFFVEEGPSPALAPAPAPPPSSAAATPPRVPSPPPTPPSPPATPPPPAAPPAAPITAAPAPPPRPAPTAPIAATATTPPISPDVASPPRRAAAVPLARPAARAKGAPIGRAVVLGGIGLVVLAAVAFAIVHFLSAPSIRSITPARVGLGQSVTIEGAHLGEPGEAVVRFGDKTGRVVQASPSRLQVEIPDFVLVPGRDAPVSVVVAVGGRESKAASVVVYEAPRIHGISPSVALPGETVVLAGAGWGAGAKVRFGGVEAAAVEASPTSLKVTVPALEGGLGKEFPVVVAMGADTSNPAPFIVGRLPLVLGVEPGHLAPGAVLTINGRGFENRAPANDVRIAGTRALVVTATGGELKVAVPRIPGGEAAVEVKVTGNEHVGRTTVTVDPVADPIDFHFVAEPFEDVAGHDHAVVASGLGPAFVLSGSGGHPAAERALDAARRLNDAAVPLKASPDADVRVQGIDTNPTLVLVGRDAPLFDVTGDDAAGYEEDWTGLKGRGGPVTRGRLATWWEAVARDLVLLLVRGDKPRHAADLAPEGRPLVDLHELARRMVVVGVPRQVMAEAKPALRDALRLIALRVPPGVKGPATEAPPAVPAFRLDGQWSGTETEGGELRYVSVQFAGAGGTLTYERALTISVPLIAVQQLKSEVRFSIQAGAGARFYAGRWDGKKVAGTISTDTTGQSQVGSFELTPR